MLNERPGGGGGRFDPPPTVVGLKSQYITIDYILASYPKIVAYCGFVNIGLSN